MSIRWSLALPCSLPRVDSFVLVYQHWVGFWVRSRPVMPAYSVQEHYGHKKDSSSLEHGGRHHEGFTFVRFIKVNWGQATLELYELCVCSDRMAR